MLSNAEFWVGVAFVVFLAIVWKVGGFRQIVSGLDARSRQIKAELEEARHLREQAESVLADYQRRRGESEKEAEALISAARDEAERIAREAHERLADFVTRRTAAAEVKIAQAEAQAAQQVREAAADAAVRISEAVLRDEVKGGAGGDILAKSLSEVRQRLHA